MPKISSFNITAISSIDANKKAVIEKDVENLSVAGELSEQDDERGNWGGKMEFILTCIGYSVGLGNIWRFPFLVYKNGGGAFLIPYWIMMLFIGCPLFFLELSLGQFSSSGPITAFRFNALAKGVGVCMITMCGILGIYYNVIIGYSLYFLLLSFRSELPWTCCGNTWNTEFCIDDKEFCKGSVSSIIPHNGSLTRTASEEFFNNYLLDVSPGISQVGNINWALFCSLLAAWSIVFLALIKGIGSLGKVVYVTATLPYVLLTAILIVGVTSDGAEDGLYYYLTPDWSRLAEGDVWADACVQLFFSLSVCFGGLITMSSYNKFNNNVLRDAIIVPLVDTFTSFYSGLVIFSVLGFMAKKSGKKVQDVVQGGPSLTFIVYPEALSKMPGPQAWSIVFFLMMCVIGLSTQFSAMETVITAMMDQFPKMGKHRALTRTGICVIWFCLGIPLITQGGYYILDVVDTFLSGFPALFAGITEVTLLSFVYGYKNFALDIKMMLGYRPPFFFAICWCFITPALLLFVIVSKIMAHKAYDSSVSWVDPLGWLVVFVCLSWIPGLAFVNYCRNSGFEVLKQNSRPVKSWGPARNSNRTGRYANQSKMLKIPMTEMNTAYEQDF